MKSKEDIIKDLELIAAAGNSRVVQKFMGYIGTLSADDQKEILAVLSGLDKTQEQTLTWLLEELPNYDKKERKEHYSSKFRILIPTTEGAEVYDDQGKFVDILEGSEGVKAIAQLKDRLFAFMPEGKIIIYDTDGLKKRQAKLRITPTNEITSNSSMMFTGKGIALDENLDVIQFTDNASGWIPEWKRPADLDRKIIPHAEYPTHILDVTDEYLLGKIEGGTVTREDGGFRLVDIRKMEVVAKGHGDYVYDGVLVGDSYFFVAHGETKVYEARDIPTGELIKSTNINAVSGSSAYTKNKTFLKGFKHGENDARIVVFDRGLEVLAEEYAPHGRIEAVGGHIVHTLRQGDKGWIPFLVHNLNLENKREFSIKPKGVFNNTESKVYFFRE